MKKPEELKIPQDVVPKVDKPTDSEKMRVVPVEELIPDIKPARSPSEGLYEHGNRFEDRFARDVVMDLRFVITKPEDVAILRERFKDKVVIDLGAGDLTWSYFLSLALGSKGYVGVEKFQGDLLENRLKNVGANTINTYWEKMYGDPMFDYSFDDDPEAKSEVQPFSKLIPAAVVREDLLSFLKRLPDNSANVFSFGIDDMVLPSPDYREKVAKEIERVLSTEGMYITDSSSIPTGNLIKLNDELKKKGNKPRFSNMDELKGFYVKNVQEV